MNKEFERYCTFLAEMMEKYGVQVMRDIATAIQFDPETWEFDAEGKPTTVRSLCKTIYEAVFKGSIRNIGILREWNVIHRKSVQVNNEI